MSFSRPSRDVRRQLTEISFSFLSTQTCTNCRLPVTCGPVYVVSDLSLLCGRCCTIAKDQYRNYAYEALGSTFLYPCINWPNHCPVKLRWNDCLDHENECNYVGCCTFICSHPGAFFKGTRDIPHDQIPLASKIVPDNLLEHLECVLCRGYLNASPVFIQSNGQNVCHRCVHANGNPPNCRRNFAYEKFCQYFLFPCTYKNKGCRVRLVFGTNLWSHETSCEHASLPSRPNSAHSSRFPDPVRMGGTGGTRPIDEQPQPQPQKHLQRPAKEKGVVKTHSGHVYATITPTKALFAPPDYDRPPDEEDVNRQLMKSLAKRQGRRRADEIGDQLGGINNHNRRDSDSESILTNESYAAKSTGGSTTPEPLDRGNNSYHQGSSSSRESTLRIPEERVVHRAMAEYPVSGSYHQSNDGHDTRLSNRDSFMVNPLLISELKFKQDQIKRTHSIRGEWDAKGFNRSNYLHGEMMQA